MFLRLLTPYLATSWCTLTHYHLQMQRIGCLTLGFGEEDT